MKTYILLLSAFYLMDIASIVIAGEITVKHKTSVIPKGKSDKTNIVSTSTFYDDGNKIAEKVEDLTGLIKQEGKIPDGIVYEYNSDGTLKGTHTYKNNQLNGLSRIYYPNGSVAIENTFVNGKMHGEAKTFDENGKLAGIAKYKNGQLIGDIKTFE